MIVLLLALPGCGGSSNQAVSGDPVAAAAGATSKQPSEKVALQGKVDPTSKPGAHTVLTMTLSDFGTAVSGPPPPAADVVDSGEVGK